MTVTIAEIYRSTKDRLSAGGISEPDTEAGLLLEIYLKVSKSDILLNGDREPDAKALEDLEKAVSERLTRRPLWYIVGKAPFMGLEFNVDERVLIPRADTEILVEEALRVLNDGSRILDMCTGSGCILLSLLKYSNDCKGLGVDLSEGALEVAKSNAALILGEEADVRFIQSDLFENVEGQFEMIVSNPPYIASDVCDTLMREVKDFEPRMALDGDKSGLVFYEKIIPEAKKRLTIGGNLLLEIGYDQGDAVRNLLEKEGFIEIQIIKDYAHLDRVASAVKSALR
ncbi:MAG: peptide chain release factor N(5)-glutamine methyltransferase [Lachnospiraceae bacterium]|nr:peptide chain release factor N(5)-glutamine methyltransferase [Lachnospiraceae bacterium]